MKRLWINAIPWNKDIVTVGLESGAEAILVEEGFTPKVKELGLIKTIAKDGDIILDKDVVFFEIKSKEDEDEAVRLSKSKILILRMLDWTIIPLENLIAKTSGFFVEVKSASEARTAFGILEKGVDGVFLNTQDPNEIKEVMRLIEEGKTLPLTVAKITHIKPLGMGDRVCIDTCSILKEGQGILVGNSSSAFYLVHSESIENPYVDPRPFRVNAGAIHAYTLTPDGTTRYLFELKAGDEVLTVDHKGKAQSAIIGRVKVERRPLMIVEGRIKDEPIGLILQNAETIRLTSKDGRAVSVLELKAGDEVLAYQEEAGRHFGIKIKETIIER